MDTRLFPFTSRPTPQWSPPRPSALHRCIFYCVNEHCSYSTKTNNNNKRKQCNVVFQGKVHGIVAFSIALMSTVPTGPKQTINENNALSYSKGMCTTSAHSTALMSTGPTQPKQTLTTNENNALLYSKGKCIASLHFLFR